MNTQSPKIEYLFALIKEMEALSTNSAATLRFHLHHICKNRWNEIWLMVEDTSSEQKQLLAKVSVANLSAEERRELDRQIWYYNPKQFAVKTALADSRFYLEAAATELHHLLSTQKDFISAIRYLVHSTFAPKAGISSTAH